MSVAIGGRAEQRLGTQRCGSADRETFRDPAAQRAEDGVAGGDQFGRAAPLEHVAVAVALVADRYGATA